jgi:hypothetical protein
MVRNEAIKATHSSGLHCPRFRGCCDVVANLVLPAWGARVLMLGLVLGLLQMRTWARRHLVVVMRSEGHKAGGGVDMSTVKLKVSGGVHGNCLVHFLQCSTLADGDESRQSHGERVPASSNARPHTSPWHSSGWYGRLL